MKQKRFTVIILIIAIVISQLSWLSFAMPMEVYAQDANVQETKTNIAKKYFYNQLTDEAKVFYDALDTMFCKNNYSELIKKIETADSKFGVDSYDLTEKFNKDDNSDSLKNSLYSKLEAYTKGNQELLNLMATARDAWMADNAGAFYIDSSNITLRVTKDSLGKFHVYIGNGRTETYINKIFWDSSTKTVKKQELVSALKKVEEEKNKIVEEVKKVVPLAGQSLEEQQARKAHDMIILANTYKLEETIISENKNNEKKGDPFNVRTVYGAFVTHEIVCEGFARSFKMIMDDLNIPCVLVYGAFTSPTQYEEHMWNYIQLEDGKWYGIDVTWDNTDEIENQGWEGNNERISTEYFVAGSDKMDMNHLVTGTMSAAKYEFKYPTLETSSDRYVTASNNDGLTVEIDAESYDEEEEIDASKLKISYAVDINENGKIDDGERMGYKKAAEKGYYIVSKFLAYKAADTVDGEDKGDDLIGGSEEGWGGSAFYGYMNPDIYASVQEVNEENGDSYNVFVNANSQFMQFGVTDVKPLDMSEIKDAHDIEKATTFFGTSSDLLAVSDMVFNPHGNYLAAPYIKRANPVLNATMYIGETYHCEVEYDDVLIPTEGHNLGDVGYNISIEYSSNKEDNTYKFENFKFDGKSTFTFDFTPSEQFADDSIYYNIEFTNLVGETSGKPPMIVNWFCAHRCAAYAYRSQGFDWNVYGKPTLMDDVNLDNLSDEENDDLSSLLKHRLTLVTTTTKPSEEKAMKELLDNGTDVDGKSLNIDGTITKTETYNINLTLCKAQKIQDGQKVRIMLGFPAGYGPEDAGVTFKAYHYIKDKSGRITGVEEIPCMITELGLIIECDSFSPFTIATITDSKLKKSEVSKSKTVIFQTSDGGSVFINDKEADSVVLENADNKKEVTLKIKPEDGFVVDNIVIGNTVINLKDKQINQDNSEEISYTLKYSDLEQEKYDALVAKVAFIPAKTKKEEENKGQDVVAQPIVAQPEFELATVTNKIVTNTEAEKKEEKQLINTLNKDDIVEITYNLTSMTDIKDKIKELSATLSYDKSSLEYQNSSIKAGEKWQNFKAEENDGTLKITGDAKENTTKADQIDEVFSLRFKVLKDEDAVYSITLSSITGKIDDEQNNPVCSDIITNIVTSKKIVEIEEDIKPKENSNYTIKDNMIFGVKPESSIDDISKELTTESNALITYYGSKLRKDNEGNIVTDTNSLLQISTKLTGDDILCTGDTAKIGKKTYIIIMSGDVDGDGDLDMTDLALVLSNYRKNELLLGIYSQAANVDENNDIDMTDVANMLNYYRKIQDSPKPDAN